MAEPTDPQTTLGDVAARQLANATKTVPQMGTISPRWLPQSNQTDSTQRDQEC